MQLTRDSLVFGGTQLTTTDIAVRAGKLSGVGNIEAANHIEEEVVTRAQASIKRLLEVRVEFAIILVVAISILTWIPPTDRN